MAKISVLTKDFDDSLLNRTDPIVYLPKVAAPFTTVVKRALMTDLANDLLPRFGVERVMIQSIQEVQGESGPNGERVFKPINDQHDAVRFVGFVSPESDSIGQRVSMQNPSYAEITFYGTGLNLLVYSDTGNRDMSISVDGGGASTVTNQGSAVLVSPARNYSPNVVINVVSLTAGSVGLHTVKVTRVSGNILLYGYEVLNINSTLQLLPGRSYLGGKRLYKAAASTDAYNSNFESGTLGTKGGHVVVYQKSDGTVAKAVQPTNASQATMTSTDHTNEVLIRTYSVFEFGAGRSDDYSRFASGAYSRAFTLDDGTTTLVTNATGDILDSRGIGMDGAGGTSFTTFTFVGTGLDVFFNQAGTFGVSNVSIDGAAGIALVNSQNTPLWIKIVSGLPYGTHTCKISVTAGGAADLFILSYNVYGPSKPSLPSGAIELADYYLMANYVVGTQGLEKIATGVIRKVADREFFYFNGTGGTTDWTHGTISPTQPSGKEIYGDRSGSYFEYTFFGTGLEFRSKTHPSFSSDMTVTFNGTLATVGNFPSLVASTYGTGTSFTAGHFDQQDGTSEQGIGLSLSGLPLAKYTVRFSNVSTGNNINISALDIITPVHSPKINQPGDLQNVLPVGSCAIGDSRKFSSTSVKALSNWVQAVGLATATTTSTSFVPMTDMSVTIKTNGNPVEISYSVQSRSSAVGVATHTQIYVDGSPIGRAKYITPIGAGYDYNQSDSFIVPMSAGVHKVDVYWKNETAATFTSIGNQRNLSAREI